MARSATDYENARWQWQKTKTICPICNTLINNWYCPNCGIPKNNSSRIIYKDIMYCCGPAHFRHDTNIQEYQLCYKCYTPNPYNANFCRSCGEDISSQASDINGHVWVDLGLSILWSAESLPEHYIWNDTYPISDTVYNDKRRWYDSIETYSRKYKDGEIEGEDSASYFWGKKWRTPTKEEFEELITKCTWEKYLTNDSDPYAFKVTGPNGRHIILKATGPNMLSKSIVFRHWTSSSDAQSKRHAYAIIGREWYDDFLMFAKSSTSYEVYFKERIEYFKERIEYFNTLFINNQKYITKSLLHKSKIINIFKEVFNLIKESTCEEDIPKDRINILIGDIERFINDNRTKLWMENQPKTLPRLNCNRTRKLNICRVHPVADKKWQGKL